MLFAIAGARLALAGAAPTCHVAKIQETLGGKAQPFGREQLALAANECRTRMAKDNPTIKISGKLIPAIRKRNETMAKLFSVPPDNMFAFVVPVIFTAAIGGPMEGFMTCKFQIKDKRLVYDRMDGRAYRRVRSPNTK